MIKVTATANGYYGNKLRTPGEQFGINREQDFSENWMTREKPEPATRRVATSGDGVTGVNVPKAGAKLTGSDKLDQAKAISGRDTLTAGEADAILAAASVTGGSDNDDRTRDMASDPADNATDPPPADDAEAGRTTDATVAIPPDWKALHYTKRIALAKAISGTDDLTADQATAIISAEADQRDVKARGQ